MSGSDFYNYTKDVGELYVNNVFGIAALRGNIPQLKLLLEGGIPVDSVDRKNNRTIGLLIQHMFSRSKESTATLEVAMRHVGVTTFLINNGATVDTDMVIGMLYAIVTASRDEESLTQTAWKLMLDMLLSNCESSVIPVGHAILLDQIVVRPLVFKHMLQWRHKFDMRSSTHHVLVNCYSAMYDAGTLGLAKEYGLDPKLVLGSISHASMSISVVYTLFKYWSMEELEIIDHYDLGMLTFGSILHRYLYYKVCPIRNLRYARLFTRDQRRDDNAVLVNNMPVPILPAEIWLVILTYATSVDNVMWLRDQPDDARVESIRKALELLGSAGIIIDSRTMERISKVYNQCGK